MCQFNEYMFDIDFKKKGEILLHRRKFLLYPKFWEDNTNRINLNLNWEKIKFKELNTSRVPRKKGIYCFVIKPKVPNFFTARYLFYIGETTRTLQIRFKEYISDQKGKGKPRGKVYEMLNLYENYIYFYYAEINNDNDIHDTEEKLINTFVPFINTQILKAKICPELKYIYEA